MLRAIITLFDGSLGAKVLANLQRIEKVLDTLEIIVPIRSDKSGSFGPCPVQRRGLRLGECEDRVAPILGVEGRKQGRAILADFTEYWNIRGDDRCSESERLDHRKTVAFIKRRHKQCLCICHQLGKGRSANPFYLHNVRANGGAALKHIAHLFVLPSASAYHNKLRAGCGASGNV